MSNMKVPVSQNIFINSSSGRIFDFNTPSSRVYLGEAVNSLLRVFGNDNIISGFKIHDVCYNAENDHISITITPGEAILDYTLIKYPTPTTLVMDVSGFDDKHGFILPNIIFNFIQTQQKNLSTIRLTYVTEDGQVPTANWFKEYSIVILAVIDFDKEKKIAKKRIIPILNREKLLIQHKQYTVYPSDNISKRILMYLNETFN